MKKLINEQFKRMQLLAGLITESQLNEAVKSIDSNTIQRTGDTPITKEDLVIGTTRVAPSMSYGSKEELALKAGTVTKVDGDKATYDVKGKMFSMDLADLLIVITTATSTNELFGFGKSKGNPNNLKAGDEVTYTASNGSDGYNGKYVVGKILSSDPKGFTMGIYRDTSEPNSPMKPEQKQISIYAKPEELKLRESIDIEKSVNEALRKYRKNN